MKRAPRRRRSPWAPRAQTRPFLGQTTSRKSQNRGHRRSSREPGDPGGRMAPPGHSRFTCARRGSGHDACAASAERPRQCKAMGANCEGRIKRRGACARASDASGGDRHFAGHMEANGPETAKNRVNTQQTGRTRRRRTFPEGLRGGDRFAGRPTIVAHPQQAYQWEDGQKLSAPENSRRACLPNDETCLNQGGCPARVR